jgi:hypothetical protein
MRSLVSRITLAGALACGAGVFACTANIHDNTVSIPNATVNMSTSADTSNVKPNEQLPIQCDVHNVTLAEPDAQAPPASPDAGAGSQADAGANAGADAGAPQSPSQNVDDTVYLEIHLDDEGTPALLVTAQVTFTVTIPADTKAGDHKVICRAHKHDGTPTSAVAELKITVKTT